jgi:HSP20 family molecular chaperone IbpA
MAARQWDLVFWQQASDLLEQAERIQRNFLQFAVSVHYQNSPSQASCWAPPVNVIEEDQRIWVIAALPGVSPDEIEIRIEENELVIAGRRSPPECCEKGELRVWEIPLGRFQRRLRLARQKLTVGDARLQNGLFIVELKKNL